MGCPIHVLVLPDSLGYYAFLPQFLRKHESRIPVIVDDRPPAFGDLCKTPVYLLEEAIFSVIPVKLAPYSDTGTGI